MPIQKTAVISQHRSKLASAVPSSRCSRRSLLVNHDVLATVQSFLDRPTLLASMSTCTALYTSAVRFLLQFDITLRSDRAVTSFSAFLNRDRHPRLYLLRKFSLDFCETSASLDLVKRLLFDVLRHSTFLEKLVLEGCTSSLADDPDVVALITNLAHLRELHILVSRDTAPALLSDLKAPVEKLDIHVLEDLGDPWEAMPMVTRFSSSLEELCLSALVTLTSVRSAPAVFPKMRRLSLNGAYFRHVEPLVAAFPNLDELFVAYAHLNSAEIEQTRLANQESQLLARWRSLHDLSGLLRALYVAAITSEVNRMSIQLVDCLATDVARLNAVLSSTRPRSLRLDFHLRHVRYLRQMIPPSDRLAHLRMCINMAACTPDMRADDILHGIYDLVRPLGKLESFFLRLYCPEWSSTESEAYRDRVAAFRGMDPPDILHALVDSVPSLRHVLLVIDPAATLLVPESASTDAEGAGHAGVGVDSPEAIVENCTRADAGCGPQTPTLPASQPPRKALYSGRALEYWTISPAGDIASAPFEQGERLMGSVGL